MVRNTCVLALCLFLTAGAALGQQASNEILLQAQQVVASAESSGAATLASSLLDEARARLSYAQANWSSTKSDTRDTARLRAAEALAAARAALAKARWLGTNAAIRTLQQDITRFGGRSDVALVEEDPKMGLARGSNSRERVAYAQTILDQARAAGGEQVPGNDLANAQAVLETAKRLVRDDPNRVEADHLAYMSEMTARRAYYTARLNDVNRSLPGLQLERTRLAQAESERSAAAERVQREQAERAASELRQQLAAEQANRRAAATELEELRQQIEDNRRAREEQTSADRAARIDAERRLDALMQQYETIVASGAPNEIEVIRRQVEDQQIALRGLQEREQMNERSIAAELEAMRNELATSRQQGTMNAQAISERETELARREAELERLRRERADELARRTEMERQQQVAVTDAQNRRNEAEARAEQLRQEILAAQQQTQIAQQQAEQATAQAQQATAQVQQTQAELDRARQQAATTQEELERTRAQLTERDAENRRVKLEAELARIASTRRDERGFIITLPGIFFDTGKSVLKAGAKTTLKRIADQLESDPSLQLTVEGHTDSVGSEASNQKLSEARANAVREYLVTEGVTAAQITASGKGEGQPIATNKTAAGRQQNRRVEIVLGR
jgi:outer membrane protein OmpA-like peptidoglycan-associated protein